MKKTIQKILVGLLFVPILAAGAIVAVPSISAAADCDGSQGVAGGASCVSTGQNQTLFGQGGLFTNVINTILFVLGAASVIMIVYGGIRYTISGGDSSSVTAAKNTILYAVIGLVVALLAFAISNFVIAAMTK
jgi:hypothetical protein